MQNDSQNFLQSQPPTIL